MKFATGVVWEREDVEIIKKALLAAKVGDHEREITALRAVGEGGVISRERLDKAEVLLVEILEAVRQEKAVASPLADPMADPMSEAYMAFAILEARYKMEKDVERCLNLIGEAQANAVTPEVDRGRVEAL